ncbi:MAG: 30S ribosomal protein S20 [Candidatus Hydrogenedentes bacterium]|nr:30S ribosomal protein S20 [Candidatus Hydrogenedentota bacterium]
MANIKSQKKRIRTNEESRQRNMAVRSRMKTMVKSAMSAIESADAEALKKAVPAALSEIDRAAAKGVIHRNSAARKKSSIQTRVARLGTPSA